MNEQFLLPVASDCGGKESVEQGNKINRILEDIYLGDVQVESFNTVPNYILRKFLLIKAAKVKLSNAVQPKPQPTARQLASDYEYVWYTAKGAALRYANADNKISANWDINAIKAELIADVDNKIWN